MEVGSRLTTALARHGIVLSLQFETDDGRNVVDAIADLNPIAVTSVFPLSGAALEAATEARAFRRSTWAVHNSTRWATLHLTIGEMRVDAPDVARPSQAGVRISPASRKSDRSATTGSRACGWPPTSTACPRSSSGRFATDGTDAADVVASLGRPDGVTAVCAESDETAFVVLHGMRQAGLRCPQDLAVMGVDARPLGAVSGPPLTSVAFDAKTIVDVSVAAMVAELGYPGRQRAEQRRTSRTLIQRAST